MERLHRWLPAAAGLFLLLGAAWQPLLAQAPQAASGPPPDFGALVARLSSESAADTPSEAAHMQSDEEQAMSMLDRAALAGLNVPSYDLAALNQRMAQFVTKQPALGEGYRLVPLAAGTPAVALVVNFGQAGPSGVRIYAGAPGHLALGARIDRFSQKDFLDDFMELVPWNHPAGNDSVFVTVAGRADELHTGIFTAWRFRFVGGTGSVIPVWTSDILPQSSYQMSADGFHLTFCAESDAADDSKCVTARRERYVWQDGMWTAVENVVMQGAVPKP